MTIESATTHAPTAGFIPVTPVGDAAVLSLVPPAMQGDHVVHPDPVSTYGIEQRPLPTSPEIPVAPLRRRKPVTPLISLPMGASLASTLSVAPLLPNQQPVLAGASPQVQPLPGAYGVTPTAFPFTSAPPFAIAPQAWGMMPQAMPVQMFVAYVMLMPVPQMMPAFSPGPGPAAGLAGS
jgi:hypothetical protein